MKKILKLIGILIGLIVILVIVILTIGYSRFNKTYDIPLSMIEIPTDENSIARGEHLVQAVAHCGYCHGTDFSGDIMVNSSGEGVIVAPNLTSGEGGIGTSYSDEDWIRALYHGVNDDARSVIIMPSLFFNVMSEDDLTSIIAYMKTIPPVDNLLPETKPGPLFYALIGAGPLAEEMSGRVIDHDAPFAEAPAESVTPEYGEYLVTIGQCRACHGAELAGGQVTRSAPIGPNLTPGGEVGFWEEQTFFSVIRTGTHPSGRELDSYMPWQFFSNMTDSELRAIRAYLLSLPKLENVMP
ncbi:MAG TPA: cytochrome c [Anaerolineales bacterium]|nr:cytochrome c [Anaerolineales bacterium]